MLCIERFEGAYAHCEDETGRMRSLSREALPLDAREGDLLVPNGADGWEIDREATAKRRHMLFLRQKRLSNP